jgi:hypothetical protein
MYSLAELRCRSSRMKRSQYSRCQTWCTAFDPGDAGSRDERRLPVKDFHDATMRATVQPSIGWKSTWTWLVHDHPGQQPVACTVEEQECILDQARGHGFSQQAASVSSVKPCLDAFAPLGILPFRWDGP